jgi:hypothetical protein
MKKQISRFSPHQNAKVFGILMAVGSLVFVLPFFSIAMLFGPDVDQHGNPVTFPKFMLILFPILYLVVGYLMTVIGCAIYNFFFRYIGGIEYEVKDENA